MVIYDMISMKMFTYTSAIEEGMFSSTHFRSSSWKIKQLLGNCPITFGHLKMETYVRLHDAQQSVHSESSVVMRRYRTTKLYLNK